MIKQYRPLLHNAPISFTLSSQEAQGAHGRLPLQQDEDNVSEVSLELKWQSESPARFSQGDAKESMSVEKVIEEVLPSASSKAPRRSPSREDVSITPSTIPTTPVNSSIVGIMASSHSG